MEHEILKIAFEEENPKSIFEIGCANGGLLIDLKNKFKNLKVGGLDISKSVSRASTLFPNGDFFRWNALDSPYPLEDKSFDIVFCEGVLMYIFDPLQVIKEMLRIAKQKVIIIEYHNETTDEFGALLKIKDDQGKIYPGIVRNYKTLLDGYDAKFIYTKHGTLQGKTIIKINK